MLRRPVARLGPIACCLLFAASCAAPDLPRDSITIRNQRVELEVVETPQARKRGLAERDSLAWHRGMLFLYDKPEFAGIWMKGMRFDIDIVWLRDGRLVDMVWRAPHDPDDPLPVYRPRELADMVLEVPAGYAQALGWRAGDRAQIERR